jgi:uncharacterized protein YceK|tara:strand:- start:268 stop:438 length:171 start_codon:yes stop_codon:yes gene_type:complete
MMKKAIVTWPRLIVGYLVFMTVILLLSGCATHHSLRMGDTTYSAGFSLDKREVSND